MSGIIPSADATPYPIFLVRTAFKSRSPATARKEGQIQASFGQRTFILIVIGALLAEGP
jgi:hypothetical protein